MQHHSENPRKICLVECTDCKIQTGWWTSHGRMGTLHLLFHEWITLTQVLYSTLVNFSPFMNTSYKLCKMVLLITHYGSWNVLISISFPHLKHSHGPMNSSRNVLKLGRRGKLFIRTTTVGHFHEMHFFYF